MPDCECPCIHLVGCEENESSRRLSILFWGVSMALSSCEAIGADSNTENVHSSLLSCPPYPTNMRNFMDDICDWSLPIILKTSWSSVSIVDLETILCPCIFCSLCLSLCQHTKCLGKQWIWIWYLHWENMFKAMSFSLIQVLAKIGFTVTSIVLAVTSIICYTLIINLVTFYIPLLL